MCDCADIFDQHGLVDYANHVYMAEMSSVVLIFRLCLIDLPSAIASPSIAWWYCSPPSVSPAP